MKNLIFVFSLLFSTMSFGQGIEFFQGTWKEGLAKAKAEGKLVFVDAYAEWCGPCKSMAKNVFTKSEVGEFFNVNFINLKLDMEKADGVSFGHEYPVRAYPTLFFIDGDGKEIKKVVGGQQVQSLLSAAADANKKNDKSGQFEEKYKAGDRSYDLMYNYIKALNAVEKPSLKISNDFLNSNPAITEEQKLTFTMEAAIDADSKLFDVVIANKEKLMALLTQKVYEEKCRKSLDKAHIKAMEFEVEDMVYKNAEKAEKTLGKEAGEKWGLKSKMNFFRLMKNTAKYKDAYKSLAKMSKTDVPTMRVIAIDIMKYYKTEKDMIADAADYIQNAYEQNPTIEALTELVNIMVSANEVNRGLEILSREKEKAEAEKKDTSAILNMIDYLNSKKV